MNEVRWGQHPLYTGKMQKYGQLLGYDAEFKGKLKRYNKFQVVFAPYWLRIESSADAPAADLDFIRDLYAYRDIDEVMATEVLATVKNHLDYLTPDLAFLSLASKRVSDEEKQRLATAIAGVPLNLAAFPPIEATKPAVAITNATQIHELAQGSRVNLVFQLLQLEPTFLHHHPTEWQHDESFQRLLKFIKNLRVTNVCAEHAVQLASTFAGKITRNEEQRQFLYSTVKKQRKERKDLSRKALTNAQ